jgi:hypothetical protein
MVMPQSDQRYCSLTCKQLGYVNKDTQPHTSVSKVVEIAPPKPRAPLPKYKRLLAMRNAYKQIRDYRLTLLEIDDD